MEVSVPKIFGSSLQETRSVNEFLGLLKEIIIPNDFQLQTLQDRQVVDVEGTIRPGEYLVVGEAQQYNCHYMLTFRQEAALPRGTPSGKLSTTDGEGGQSQRDNSKESAALKSRLIARDKGCVVCIAQV